MKLPLNVSSITHGDLVVIFGPLGIVKAMHNSNYSTLKKMNQAVTVGHKVKLKFIGTGYKAILNKGQLDINIGFKNPVKLSIPLNIKISLKANGTIIEGFSTNLEALTSYCSRIELLKPARSDIYRGKGITRIM